ncbi:hypothetical protein HPB47_000299 [Ixodes persulcatus]|uniref:Uncharacterized protein n=1 Tax=Ixodes persulcatus TaxID=34615 RepID=A0AC60PTH1_IXOPE|nr:hypothetical protein HPB47_000299 [Ixodes persulcatus]
MPKQKSVKPLYRLCVSYVSSNIQQLCPEHNPVAYVFPAHVNEDLVDALQSYKQSNFVSLNHLLTHRLRRVSLSFIDCHLPIGRPSRLPDLLSQISMHGKQLLELSLVGAVHQDDSTLVAALCELPRLRRLSLCLNNVTDRVVSVIAQHCTDLVELRFSGQRTTDQSLYLLAACKQLRCLLVESDLTFESHITVSSSYRILEELPQLRSLKMPFLTEALLLFPDTWRLALTHYTERGLSPLLRCSTAFEHIVKVCPRLTKVSLVLTGLETITPLRHLEALNDLTLRVTSFSSDMFFKTQVEPVLQEVGCNVRMLTLSLPEVDIGAISRRGSASCQRLKFFPHEVNSMTSGELFEMLKHAGDLIEACLGWCQLTDAALGTLVSSGTFAKLREFELNEVDCITGVGLEDLVTTPSDLTSLTVFGCDGVSRTDIEHLRNLISDLNLDLVIRFFEL